MPLDSAFLFDVPALLYLPVKVDANPRFSLPLSLSCVCAVCREEHADVDAVF